MLHIVFLFFNSVILKFYKVTIIENRLKAINNSIRCRKIFFDKGLIKFRCKATRQSNDTIRMLLYTFPINSGRIIESIWIITQIRKRQKILITCFVCCQQCKVIKLSSSSIFCLGLVKSIFTSIYLYTNYRFDRIMARWGFAIFHKFNDTSHFSMVSNCSGAKAHFSSLVGISLRSR